MSEQCGRGADDMLDLVRHLLRQRGDLSRRDTRKVERILGGLKEKLENLKIEQLEMELGLLRVELTEPPSSCGAKPHSYRQKDAQGGDVEGSRWQPRWASCPTIPPQDEELR